MPEMDGITFCVNIKNDERTSHIPVIMLTAKGGHENKMEGLGTGADDYLTKPFNRQELLMRIQNLITQRNRLREKYSRQITLQPKDIVITSVDESFLKKIEDLIEKNLAVPEFGTPELQEMLAMSKTQFHRKIKALTGHTPGALIRNYRLRRAAQMLEKRSGNVTEIAFAVGFGSLSYFVRSFKEFFGTVPSDYKSRS
jgi:AraC-like DNA-binding protein